MEIKMPKNVEKEALLILHGKKLRKTIKKEPVYPAGELFSRAAEKVEFLNTVAITEPIFSVLDEDYDRIIMVLSEFNAYHPQPGQNVGSLVLTKGRHGAALYYWVDADYPANRSEEDFRFVTEKSLGQWHSESLKRFALLAEKEIWRNIRIWLIAIRRHL